MKIEEKKAIVEAVISYIRDKKISQNELAKMVGINPSYMSSILNGNFTFINKSSGKSTEIDDKYFSAIAKKIGYSVKKEYWPLVETEQFIDIAKELTEAKNTHTTRILIGETGCGKTYTVEKFAKAYPRGTFVITCNKNDRISDLIRKIETALGCKFEGSNSYKIDKISAYLSRMYDSNENPIIIFDESEYLSITGLLSIKTIYDYLRNMCSIVLIGTEDILNKLERNIKKEGVPQFYRRFKAGVRRIRPLDRSFSLFFSGKGYSPELRRLLSANADNYGELSDYLEPAIREADRRGVPLTEEFFKKMFYLQN